MHQSFLHSDPEFWQGFLSYLYEKRANMRDQATANRLFNLCVQHIESKNIPGMANIVRQLWQLLPPEDAAAAPGDLGSTIQ